MQSELNENQEKMILIRERKASSGATIEGLKKKKRRSFRKSANWT